MQKKIIAIWAEDRNHVIGKDQTLPWYLPKELQHFKKTTMGEAILMGRITFDGMNRRILPGRSTLVLTRDQSFTCEGVEVMTSKEAVLEWFNKHDKTLYIIGGAAVFETFLPYCDGLIKTEIAASIDGDTYFPDYDLTNFIEVETKREKKDANNPYDFTIRIFERS